MDQMLEKLIDRLPGARRVAESLGLILPLWHPVATTDHTYYSQHGQDRWVAERIFKESKFGGYFLEMGATDRNID